MKKLDHKDSSVRSSHILTSNLPKKNQSAKMSKNTADHLFPSEDESLSDTPVKAKLKVHKKRKAASTSSSQPSTSKKQKIHPITPATKATARELFGSDSDDDALEVSGEKKPPPVYSYITRRLANGFSRQMDEQKKVQPAAHISQSSNVIINNETSQFDISEQEYDANVYESNCLSKTIHCDKCKLDIPEHKYRYHKRTNIHKSNCLMKSRFENVEIMATAFKNRIMTYRLNPSKEDENLIPEAFLDEKRQYILEIIKFLVSKNTSIKVNFELFAYFILPKSNEQQLKSFNTKYEVIYNSTDVNKIYSNIIEGFKRKLTEFEHCESGWSFVSISHLEMNIALCEVVLI